MGGHSFNLQDDLLGEKYLVVIVAISLIFCCTDNLAVVVSIQDT